MRTTTMTSNSLKETLLQSSSAFPGIDPNKLYSTQELATLTGMTESYFEAARSRGGGPSFTRLGRRVKYPGTAVIDWLLRGRCQDGDQGGGEHA